jgi:hypothetical protein
MGQFWCQTFDLDLPFQITPVSSLTSKGLIQEITLLTGLSIVAFCGNFTGLELLKAYRFFGLLHCYLHAFNPHPKFETAQVKKDIRLEVYRLGGTR